MESFSLLDAPWLRVLDREGTVREVGLLEAFEKAHELRRLLGNTASEEAALLRLLTAILYRALPAPGPSEERSEQWNRWWTAATLPIAQINDYLEKHRDRFDLFGVTPFMQVADLDAGKTSGLVKLIPDAPDGEPYFTVRSGPALTALSFAEAARFLVHSQAFDPSGIKTGAHGDGRVKGGRGYPIGTGWSGSCGLLLAQGVTLKDTLLLNLVLSIPSKKGDHPVWEVARGPITAQAAGDMSPPQPTDPRGPADLLTWPARRIRLFTEDDQVTDVLLCNGDPIHGRNRHQTEPHCAWRRSEPQEKKHGVPVVYMPRTHDPARALWRGLQGILPHTVTGGKVRDGGPNSMPPKVLEWIAELVIHECLPKDYPVQLRAIGIEYGPQSSTIAAVVDDDVVLPSAVVADEVLQQHVVAAVDDANHSARALADLARNLARAEGSTDAHTLDGHAMRAFETAYAALDLEFRSWLTRLVPGASRTALFSLWHTRVRHIIERLGVDLVRAAAQPAYVGRKTTINRRDFHMDSGLAYLWFRDALNRALPHADGGGPTSPKAESVPPDDAVDPAGAAT